MFKKSLCLALVYALTISVSTTSADTIYLLDYNTVTATPGDYNPNFDQADPTAISTLAYQDLVGLDGTRAVQVDFDTTSDPFSVSYFTNLASSGVDPATSSNLADYTLSFDVRIEGFDADDSQVFTQYRIDINDERFEGTLNSTAAFQTVTSTLSSLSSTGAGTFVPADFSTGTQQFRVDFLGLNNRFDLDNDNAYFIDNIRLSAVAVPEPSSLAFIGLSCFAAVTRRRKSVRV